MDYKERLDMAVARQQAILTAMQLGMLKKVSKKLEFTLYQLDPWLDYSDKETLTDAKESIDRELEWREEKRIEEANLSSNFEY